ncbi:MAG: carboxymuconolactone decarboxylase family protein [Xanthobacteraceae bacterium]
MARIPLPSPETMTPEQRRVYDQIVTGPRGRLVGPLRAALHRPELAEKWQQFGELLRYRTSLPPMLSELAILVTARHTRSNLEWHIHEQMAEKAELPRPVIDAVRKDTRPVSGNADFLIVYDYACELNENCRVSEPVYARALERFGAVGVVELTALIGYYTMVAMTLNAHEIPLPDGATPVFP